MEINFEHEIGDTVYVFMNAEGDRYFTSFYGDVSDLYIAEKTVSGMVFERGNTLTVNGSISESVYYYVGNAQCRIPATLVFKTRDDAVYYILRRVERILEQEEPK